MNIQLANLSEETSVRTDKSIDSFFIDRFLKGVLRLPTEIRLRFKAINGTPAIKVYLTYQNRIKETLTTIANESLINAVIAVMGGNLKPIQEFASNGNTAVEESSENFELEMFQTFIRSKYRLTIEEDFISPSGGRFLHAVFSIGYHSQIHFYLKRDEHIEELLNEVLTSKAN